MSASRLIVTLVLVVASQAVDARQPQQSALRIVVLEGEGAVNVIQQKTAVRPLVEVRDRNNVPVAGATVTFTIGGSGQSAAFAGGAQTLTVTTNAAGQAAASGINAIGSGAFQIQVQAAYQGQIATAAISQTNVATAAAASQAGAGVGGAAGGGGGGISGATLGIIGGAVAGGAVAATQVAGKSDESSGSTTPFTGSLSGQLAYTSVSTASTCVRTQALTGTVRIQMTKENSSGTAEVQVTQTETSLSGPCSPAGVSSFGIPNVPVTVNGSSITFTGNSVNGVTTNTVKFDGQISGDSITGTLAIDIAAAGDGVATPRGNGNTTMQVSLRR